MMGEQEKEWLDHTLNSSDVLHLLARPYPAEKLAAYPVSREFNSRSGEDQAGSVLLSQEYDEMGDLGF